MRQRSLTVMFEDEIVARQNAAWGVAAVPQAK
jgi:hypothetical protein